MGLYADWYQVRLMLKSLCQIYFHFLHQRDAKKTPKETDVKIQNLMATLLNCCFLLSILVATVHLRHLDNTHALSPKTCQIKSPSWPLGFQHCSTNTVLANISFTFCPKYILPSFFCQRQAILADLSERNVTQKRLPILSKR